MKRTRTLFLFVVMVVLGYAQPGFAQSEFEKFFGRYVGSDMSDSTDMSETRSSDVAIKPYQEGFNVTWNTISTRTNTKVKKSTFSINFRPSKQRGVYGSAMSKDMFGNEKPLDPLNGDPYVWAYISGDTLTVNSLLVAENGGYEIQTYERTLIDGGMSLVFSRVQNGEIQKQFRGHMKKVE